METKVSQQLLCISMDQALSAECLKIKRPGVVPGDACTAYSLISETTSP